MFRKSFFLIVMCVFMIPISVASKWVPPHLSLPFSVVYISTDHCDGSVVYVNDKNIGKGLACLKGSKLGTLSKGKMIKLRPMQDRPGSSLTACDGLSVSIEGPKNVPLCLGPIKGGPKGFFDGG